MAAITERLMQALPPEIRDEIEAARAEMAETRAHYRDIRRQMDEDFPYLMLAATLSVYYENASAVAMDDIWDLVEGLREQVVLRANLTTIEQVREIDGFGGTRGIEIYEGQLLFEDGRVYEEAWPALDEGEVITTDEVAHAFVVSDALRDKDKK